MRRYYLLRLALSYRRATIGAPGVMVASGRPPLPSPPATPSTRSMMLARLNQNLLNNLFASACVSLCPIISFAIFHFLGGSWPSVNLIQSIERSPHSGINERWGRLDDDEDLVVVAVAKPVELHQPCRVYELSVAFQ